MMSRIGTEKHSNYEYAPGIATYGIDGRDGGDGVNGNTLFISVYNINDKTDAGLFGTAVLRSLDMTDRTSTPIDRNYIDGDTFLFQDGTIWRLDNAAGLKNAAATGQIQDISVLKNYISPVGSVQSSTDSGFNTSGDFLVLDSTNYKGVVLDTTGSAADALKDHTAPFTVISTNADNDSIIRFVSMKGMFAGQADTNFNIYYDTDNNAWVLNSDRPVLFDCDVKLKMSDEGMEDFDEYSTPLIDETPMTRFYALCRNKLSYSIGAIKQETTALSNARQVRNMSRYSMSAPVSLEYGANDKIIGDNVISLMFYKDVDSTKVFMQSDFTGHTLRINVMYNGVAVKNPVVVSNWDKDMKVVNSNETVDDATVYLKRRSGTGASAPVDVCINAARLLAGVTMSDAVSVNMEWEMSVFSKPVIVPLSISLMANASATSKVPVVLHVAEGVTFDDLMNKTVHIVYIGKSGVIEAEYYTIIDNSMRPDFVDGKLNITIVDKKTFSGGVWSVSLIDAVEVKLSNM